MPQPVIESLMPGAGIEGGEVVITCRDFLFSTHDEARVKFDGIESRPISASSTRVIAPIPSSSLVEAGEVWITLETNGSASAGHTFVAGRKLSENLHPVANPAVDSEGRVFVTFSGARGQQVPVSIFSIDRDFQ
ncbi:MAG TPA: IPT/TIG domain-containing protein, partial [Blastocatellia bacterium]|nr:IPT/TIG domain-containing protein [Blastocatellia bacterium]